jgi:hypothetical protein
MRRLPLESRALRSAGYEAGTLEVEFTSGSVYRYRGVPERVWRELLAAESHGSYFTAHIRDRFPYARVR